MSVWCFHVYPGDGHENLPGYLQGRGLAGAMFDSSPSVHPSIRRAVAAENEESPCRRVRLWRLEVARTGKRSQRGGSSSRCETCRTFPSAPDAVRLNLWAREVGGRDPGPLRPSPPERARGSVCLWVVCLCLCVTPAVSSRCQLPSAAA